MIKDYVIFYQKEPDLLYYKTQEKNYKMNIEWKVKISIK